MAAECFWTNKVNVFEDCGGGVDPPDPTGDVWKLRSLNTAYSNDIQVFMIDLTDAPATHGKRLRFRVPRMQTNYPFPESPYNYATRFGLARWDGAELSIDSSHGNSDPNSPSQKWTDDITGEDYFADFGPTYGNRAIGDGGYFCAAFGLISEPAFDFNFLFTFELYDADTGQPLDATGAKAVFLGYNWDESVFYEVDPDYGAYFVELVLGPPDEIQDGGGGGEVGYQWVSLNQGTINTSNQRAVDAFNGNTTPLAEFLGGAFYANAPYPIQEINNAARPTILGRVTIMLDKPLPAGRDLRFSMRGTVNQQVTSVRVFRPIPDTTYNFDDPDLEPGYIEQNPLIDNSTYEVLVYGTVPNNGAGPYQLEIGVQPYYSAIGSTFNFDFYDVSICIAQ